MKNIAVKGINIFEHNMQTRDARTSTATEAFSLLLQDVSSWCLYSQTSTSCRGRDVQFIFTLKSMCEGTGRVTTSWHETSRGEILSSKKTGQERPNHFQVRTNDTVESYMIHEWVRQKTRQGSERQFVRHKEVNELHTKWCEIISKEDEGIIRTHKA